MSAIRKIRQLAARAVINLIQSDASVQRLQVSAGDGQTLDGVEHIEPYGFTAHPKSGSEAIVLCLNGNTSHPVVIIAGDRRYRLKGLAAGEVALYTDEGDKIVLQRGGKILIDSAAVTITGSLQVNGSIHSDGDTVAGSISLQNHTHAETNSVTKKPQ